MEMYTADHGLNLGESSTGIVSTTSSMAMHRSDENDNANDPTAHPGILVALNAAAMDGGLDPLGSSSEFAPLAVPSSTGDTALPPYPVPASAVVAETSPSTTTSVAAAPAAPTAPVAPIAAVDAPSVTVQLITAPPAAVPVAVTSAPAAVATAATPIVVAKRPVAAITTTAAQAPMKKQRKGITVPSAALAAATTTPKIAAVPAKLALSGGIKVVVPPRGAAPITRSTIGRVVPQTGVISTAIKITAVSGTAATATKVPPPSATLLKKVPVTTAQVKPSVIPKAIVGGVMNRQVLARPSVVPSSTAASARMMPPASALTIAARANMVKKPDLTASMTICATTGVLRAKSEADFKDVASAAVSSLIQNATSTLSKTGPKPVGITKQGDKAVDVSTAHINALTSQNWVTACNPVPTPEPSSASACDKAARNARRATLTQEERAKQNRDRNREHARNTRLRKKAYVEELKRTLTELVAQRDAADLEKRHEAQRNREQREVRFRVMEEFLKLRGRNELNAARWVAILEDGFTFTLPRTSFRRMVDADKSSKDVSGAAICSSSVEQVLRGAAVVMEDSQHFSSYLQTIAGPASSTQVQIVYRCDRKRFFMDGNVAFMDFDAGTLGAVSKGAPNEITMKGSMRASFSPASNKLISVDMTFDSGAFVQQVQSLGDASNDAAAVAAHEADALLDSLQMPQIFVDKNEVAAAAEAAGPVSVSSDDGEFTDGSTALLNP